MPIFSNWANWWGAGAFEYASDAFVFVGFVSGVFYLAFYVLGRAVGRFFLGVSRRDLAVFFMGQVLLFAVWLGAFKWVVKWQSSQTLFSLSHGWTQTFVKFAGVVSLFVGVFGLIWLLHSLGRLMLVGVKGVAASRRSASRGSAARSSDLCCGSCQDELGSGCYPFSVSDAELPGLWSVSDFVGGSTDAD